MERELFTKLERWMNKKNRKPLIIQGARQVGKTWIMKEFGARFYENTVYINFDNNNYDKKYHNYGLNHYLCTNNMEK